MADVGEEESLGDGDVGGVLVGGGVGGALVGVPLPANMGIALNVHYQVIVTGATRRLLVVDLV